MSKPSIHRIVLFVFSSFRLFVFSSFRLFVFASLRLCAFAPWRLCAKQLLKPQIPTAHKKTGPGVNQDRRAGNFANGGVGAAAFRGQFSSCEVTQGIVISAITSAMTLSGWRIKPSSILRPGSHNRYIPNASPITLFIAMSPIVSAVR